MKHSKEFAEFVARLLERLEQGERTYGDASFTGPLARTLDEIEAECLDLCGWSWIFWCKVQRLKDALRAHGGDARPRRSNEKAPS